MSPDDLLRDSSESPVTANSRHEAILHLRDEDEFPSNLCINTWIDFDYHRTNDGLNLRTSPRSGSMPSRATLRLQVWTEWRLGFRINLASLHADLSILTAYLTAYLTVIYREKALPGRGRFIISAWASKAAENVDSQELEEEQDSKNGRSNFQRLRYIRMFWRKAMLMPLGVAMLGEFPQIGRAHFHEGRLVRLDG